MNLRPVAVGLVLAWLLASWTAWADSRSSHNYSVTTETLDAGGLRATSADYVLDASLGGLTGVSSAFFINRLPVYGPPPRGSRLTEAGATLGTYRALDGYMGQLYEVTGLSLRANPATIPGGGTTQLSGVAVLDDSTFLDLSGAELAWGPAPFPFAAISSLGVASAGNPGTNFVATIPGSYLGKEGSVAVTVEGFSPELHIAYRRDHITISWTGGGTLEVATDVTGPYVSTGNSTGTFTAVPLAASLFYRVRQ